MKYNEALDFIHGTNRFGSKLGLENIEYLLKLLGNPEKSLKIIHVAGTNGKGSTCSFLNQALIENNYKIGLYTSPFLETFNERIKINNQNISNDDLGEITELVKSKIDFMTKNGYPHPTEFEIVTAIALVYFNKKQVDFLILEVGLGGRLDATNIVKEPILSIITSIGYDHTDFLGSTIDKIAYEKAGIIKENIPTIIYPQEKAGEDMIVKIANEKNSPLFKVNFNSINILNQSLESQEYQFDEESILEKLDENNNWVPNKLNSINNVKISLLGNHQIYNSLLAFSSLLLLNSNYNLNLSLDNILNGLLSTKWNGRLELLKRKPNIIIDGAHNLQAGRAIKNTISSISDKRNITLVIGMLKDKDIDGFFNEILPLGSNVIFTKPLNPRAEDPDKLYEKSSDFTLNKYVEENISKAIIKAIDISDNNSTILVLGSLYMIGEARTFINNL